MEEGRVRKLSLWQVPTIPLIVTKKLPGTLLLSPSPDKRYELGDKVRLSWRANNPFYIFCPLCGYPRIFCSFHDKKLKFTKNLGLVEITEVQPIELWIGYGDALIKDFTPQETEAFAKKMGLTDLEAFQRFILRYKNISTPTVNYYYGWRWLDETNPSG